MIRIRPDEKAKLAILELVEVELAKYINNNQIPPANFANNIALYFLRSKINL